MRPQRTILSAVAASVILTGTLCALADTARPGSVDRQLLLQRRLQKALNGTLIASLEHNRRQWNALSPDQRDKVRRDVLAFQAKSADEQKKLLEMHQQINNLPEAEREALRQRAKWLAVVIASFTPEQRQTLKALPPEQRAQRILDRRAELVKQGKLSLDETPAPTTQPPSQE